MNDPQPEPRLDDAELALVANGGRPARGEAEEGARAAFESAMYEIKRVVVGQDAMLERVLVALLAGGHVLLEGVPGLAKTLTVKTLAGVVGGSFSRIQFTPDLVPSDLVGTRIFRPDSGRFDTELGPVISNFLLADEINRAPAKVQSALLEVMQEHQVTIGAETHRVPEPFLVLATQNPIESEGTYPLPEAQVDRFLLKLIVDYPSPAEEVAIVDRVVGRALEIEERLSAAELLRLRALTREVYVDREVVQHAVDLVDATRRPGAYGLSELEPLIEYGASPRGSIGLIEAARALALLRGRWHVTPNDVRALAGDVLRHRLLLTYDAITDGVEPDRVIDQILSAVAPPARAVGHPAAGVAEAA
jgi:MoxR-like ATPase